jgi:membrane-bound inhibitor of C-type lysozyme
MKSNTITLAVSLLAATPALAAEGRLVNFRCDNGGAISVTFARQQALLAWNGKILPLDVTPSAGGARYANGPYVLWNKGNEVRLEIDGKPELNHCRETREGLDVPPAFHMGDGEGLKVPEKK